MVNFFNLKHAVYCIALNEGWIDIEWGLNWLWMRVELTMSGLIWHWMMDELTLNELWGLNWHWMRVELTLSKHWIKVEWKLNFATIDLPYMYVDCNCWTKFCSNCWLHQNSWYTIFKPWPWETISFLKQNVGPFKILSQKKTLVNLRHFQGLKNTKSKISTF